MASNKLSSLVFLVSAGIASASSFTAFAGVDDSGGNGGIPLAASELHLVDQLIPNDTNTTNARQWAYVLTATLVACYESYWCPWNSSNFQTLDKLAFRINRGKTILKHFVDSKDGRGTPEGLGELLNQILGKVPLWIIPKERYFKLMEQIIRHRHYSNEDQALEILAIAGAKTDLVARDGLLAFWTNLIDTQAQLEESSEIK